MAEQERIKISLTFNVTTPTGAADKRVTIDQTVKASQMLKALEALNTMVEALRLIQPE